MTHRSLAASRSRRTAVVAAASFATALTTLSGAGSAGAAEPPDPADACTAYDLDADLDGADVTGMDVTGLTVAQGTTPDAFSGEVLGVVDDGIAPGTDLLIARLTSPEIDRFGIWAGMSGSPVYAPDGRLLGAVAYSLSFGPSAVAGITPAAAMLEVADGASAARSPRRVELPAALQRKLTARTRVSARAVDAGLASLKTPVGVSGVSRDKQLTKLKRTLGISGTKLYRAAPAPAAPGDPSTIVAGGNLAVSLTYGDFSYTGVGTVTAVCDGAVVGFGHPFTYEGPTSLTMQSASAVYVQEDPVFSGFKVANATGPVGTITQDRLAGVAGSLGPVPVAVPITASASLDEDRDGTAERSGTGTTYASKQDYVAFATFYQTLVMQDRVYDRYAPGSGTGHFTVSGSSVESGAFTLERTNRHASRWDLSYAMADEAPTAVDRLFRNKYTDLTFDAVTVESVMNPEPRLFKVGRVEQKIGGEWSKLRRYGLVQARAGKTLKFRVTLTSDRGRYGTKVRKVSIGVPETTGRGWGYLAIGGGTSWFGSGGGGSFDGLVGKLEDAPRNDELTASMYLDPRRGATIRKERATPVGDVVNGGRFYELALVKSGSGDVLECRTTARGC